MDRDLVDNSDNYTKDGREISAEQLRGVQWLRFSGPPHSRAKSENLLATGRTDFQEINMKTESNKMVKVERQREVITNK